MDEKIISIARTIQINTSSLNEISENKKTLKYLESIDYSSMPETIREMNQNLLDETRKKLEDSENQLIIINTHADNDEAVKYLEQYPQLDELIELKEVRSSYENILNSDIEICEQVKNKIEELLTDSKKSFDISYKKCTDFINKRIRQEFLGETFEVPEKKTEEKKKVQLNYSVKKSTKNLDDIKEIITSFIKKNEFIFNKIIFDGKGVSLSITDRIIDIYFKPGIGYVVNFISEPDTNMGKFYQNLLKVFGEIKEQLYLEYDIVVVPEEGKNLNYLNSFYQNYVFMKEKLESILIRYKLEKSLLNETFSINHMIFDKSCNKYIVFYNGNLKLSEAVEQYLNNQAKLGTINYGLEFIEHDGNIQKSIKNRYENQVNKIDLSSENICFKLKNLSEKRTTSAFAEVSGVSILLDPCSKEKFDNIKDIDILVLSNTQNENIDLIPVIMAKNPDTKLFTSDISFRLARAKWYNTLNNANFIENDQQAMFSKKDIDSINDRVIRITPEGKGYNFKGMVNIKFMAAGNTPGNALVELRDAENRILYVNNLSIEDTELMKKPDIDTSEYNYIIMACDLKKKTDILKVESDKIKDKLTDKKQVFIFSDNIGNMQHVTLELFKAGIENEIIAGDALFTLMNKEIAKLINFGSSWGENLKDRDSFMESTNVINPFIDEYEFYKKFSTDDPYVFIVPFSKEEIDMLLKNKLTEGHLIYVPSEFEESMNQFMKDFTSAAGLAKSDYDNLKIFNYISSPDQEYVDKKITTSQNLKKIITLNTVSQSGSGKTAYVQSELKVY